MQLDDETIDFLTDEAPPAESSGNDEVWKLLIVDDDEEVHEATLFALQGTRLCGRRLQLIRASSAAEAAAIMECETEIAVLLLDVVMESPDAGLQLVKHIRQDLQRTEVRIVLRTGQPGQAPELEVIRDYDINDYKTKAELTHTRLITTLIAAIRSYEQLQALSDNQRGLEMVVSGATELMQAGTLAAFAKQALVQITALLRLPGDGLVCAEKAVQLAAATSEDVYIVAATGNLAGYSGQRLDHLGDPDVAAILKDCINRRHHSFGARHIALYLRERNQEAVLFVRSNKVLTTVDRQLAEVFAANIATCFGNVRLVERLNFVAYHDPLTGLANRTRFLADLGKAGVLAKPGQVVCLLDVIHFTDINNSLGQEVGDRLLVAIARRLSYACRDCRVAHIGADRFGLLGDEAQLAPERMLALAADPFAAGEHQLQVGINLGYCRINGREAGDTLFKRADLALGQARLSPNVRHIDFTPEMEARTHWRLDVIRRLRQDFQAGQLEVWYQPQVSLADGHLVGLEALARWPGNGGFVHPPEVFIKLAEDAGLIVELGAWVLERSCATYRSLRDAGHALHHIAVNVSMPQFRQPDFPERVMAILAAHDMPATALELEITESLLLDEPAVVLRNLETLRQAGVLISIDDFGTGYSSLSYLRQLPVDCLKIDRSFVLEIDKGKGDLFAQTIVELARKLGIDTVAEGVETQAQVERLRELGCDTVQGFLYAYPMPASELAQWCVGRSPSGGSLN